MVLRTDWEVIFCVGGPTGFVDWLLQRQGETKISVSLAAAVSRLRLKSPGVPHTASSPCGISLNDRRASQHGGWPEPQVSYCLVLQESEDHLCCSSLVKQVTVATSTDVRSSTRRQEEKARAATLHPTLSTPLFSANQCCVLDGQYWLFFSPENHVRYQQYSMKI